MSNARVFITKRIPDAGIQILKDAGFEVTVYNGGGTLSQEELIQQCKEHDALLSAGGGKLDATFLKACSHLKVIALLSVGYDNVDIEAATKLNIPIGNTPDVLSRSTSDVAFLLMLAVSRKAFFNYRKITQGNWGPFDPMADLGQELYGKTLGVFGLGKIGLELARKCKAAFDMKIIYHNRSHNKAAEELLGATYVNFRELLEQSDVLSLHANLSEETKGVFNKAAFDKMKPNAIFVNTGRGGLHNEADLTIALKENVIWGAGLDVTNPEPMDKSNELLRMPNVCVLPHIGSATIEARNGMAIMAANNIVAGLSGQKLPTIVNPEVYD